MGCRVGFNSLGLIHSCTLPHCNTKQLHAVDYAVPGRPPSTVKLCHVPRAGREFRKLKRWWGVTPAYPTKAAQALPVPGTLPKALPGSYRSASQMLPVHWAQRPFTLEGWANAALEGRAVCPSPAPARRQRGIGFTLEAGSEVQ